MAKKVKITSVLGTENLTKIILSVDGVVQNHTAITGCKVHSSKGTILADSTITPAIWDFTNAGFLTVKLGLSDLPLGTADYILVMKTALHPVGYAWDTLLEVTQLA
jgi:hypothetical protein